MSLIASAFGDFGSTGVRPALSASAGAADASAPRATAAIEARRRTAGGILRRVSAKTRVDLPPGVAGPIEVYVNGVRQVEGRDFGRRDDSLVFDRELAREGRLGFWRWLSIVLGIAGTYRQNDSVDVVYERGGRRMVAPGLPLVSDE